MSPSPPSAQYQFELEAESIAEAYTHALRDQNLDELKAVAVAIARDMRRRNLPPEKMLIEAKNVLPAPSALTFYRLPDPTRAMYDRVISWCIVEYYRPSE
ncbi:MAG TPA: hypothetical protein VH277_00035 [Gemmatimonadaceae bacterium]|jgi:hypothetical protein|nr:hypothetical protein [Gemmatimonadaceae bacterium]